MIQICICETLFSRSIDHQFTYSKRVNYWLCPSRDDPGMIGVSRESQVTQTGWISSLYHRMILGWSKYISQVSQDTQTGGDELCPSRDDPGTVVVSRESHNTQTEWGVSCVHPGIMMGWLKYLGNPRILRRRGGKHFLSQNDPGMVVVSQESHDTQRGGE